MVEDVTELLLAWSDGDREALDRLVPLVYAELRRRAQAQLSRERGTHTLQPTALVHETFLRLIDQRGAHWQNRAQFFAVAARSCAASWLIMPADGWPQNEAVARFG